MSAAMSVAFFSRVAPREGGVDDVGEHGVTSLVESQILFLSQFQHFGL